MSCLKKTKSTKELRGIKVTSTIISIITLGIAISAISIWWVATTLKEGRNAIEETQKEKSGN